MDTLSQYSTCDPRVPIVLECARLSKLISHSKLVEMLGIEKIGVDQLKSYESGLAIPSKQTYEALVRILDSDQPNDSRKQTKRR